MGTTTHSFRSKSGRYELFHQIGSGGMASVHLGRLVSPLGFARTVAIKRLHRHLAADDEFVDMFLNEARLAARISHPNVVATLDVVSSDTQLFHVMEYIEGETLAKLQPDTNKGEALLPRPFVANVISGVLHGLHAAHEARNERGELLGLVHRDMSPQNILVGTDGITRLLDFGVAKAPGQLATTHNGMLKGKICYMSPEQLQGERATRQTDIHAVGVVFWEALTGRRLYNGNCFGEIANAVAKLEVPKPSEFVPGLDEAFDRIVLKACAHDPGQRYASALEMVLDIEHSLRTCSQTDVGTLVETLSPVSLAYRRELIERIGRELPTPAPLSRRAREEVSCEEDAPAVSLPFADMVTTIEPVSLSSRLDAMTLPVASAWLLVGDEATTKVYVAAARVAPPCGRADDEALAADEHSVTTQRSEGPADNECPGCDPK